MPLTNQAAALRPRGDELLGAISLQSLKALTDGFRPCTASEAAPKKLVRTAERTLGAGLDLDVFYWRSKTKTFGTVWPTVRAVIVRVLRSGETSYCLVCMTLPS